MCLNTTALRKAKLVCNFGLSECNMVKHVTHVSAELTVREKHFLLDLFSRQGKL